MAEHEEEPLVAELGHKIDTILGEIQDKKEAYSHKDHLYESSLTNLFWKRFHNFIRFTINF